MKHRFRAEIYKIGMNWCIDVPLNITEKIVAIKGYIHVKGTINNFAFVKTLVPVKNSAYRLFVNSAMMKGGKTALGEMASFTIEHDHEKVTQEYPMPRLLVEALDSNGLTEAFESLTPSRKRDILKYLSYLRTVETLNKNIAKLIVQLKNQQKNVRIP